MFDRILIPLDGSSRAELILAQLKPLIKSKGTNVFIVQGVYGGISMARMDSGKLAAERTAEAVSYLEHIVHRLVADGVQSRGIVKKEAPEDAILGTAKELGVDLIAMTTHGRAGFQRWMMGTVTEKVLRSAEVPLLVFHSFKRTPDGATIPLAGEPVIFKTILIPIDVGEKSLAIIPWIERLAKVYESEVVLLNVRPVVPPDSPGPYPSSPPIFVEGQPKPEIPVPPTVSQARERLAAAGVKVRTLMKEGNPSEEILATASTGEYDLIAMATHGRSALKRWVMGSFAERILRSSPIPIFVVPS